MNLNIWYVECIERGIKEHTYYKKKQQHSFVVYNGFKILRITQKEGYSFFLIDTRKSDFFSNISEEEEKVLGEHGFMVGANRIHYLRNRERIIYYNNEIDKEFRKIRSLERNQKETSKMIIKKKKIAERNILELGELLRYYRDKCYEYEQKQLESI